MYRVSYEFWIGFNACFTFEKHVAFVSSFSKMQNNKFSMYLYCYLANNEPLEIAAQSRPNTNMGCLHMSMKECLYRET
jgi:hypothetical protein